MRDVVMVVAVVAFFALTAAYVRWCDGLLGPDPLSDPDTAAEATSASASAATEDAR